RMGGIQQIAITEQHHQVAYVERAVQPTRCIGEIEPRNAPLGENAGGQRDYVPLVSFVEVETAAQNSHQSSVDPTEADGAGMTDDTRGDTKYILIGNGLAVRQIFENLDAG